MKTKHRRKIRAEILRNLTAKIAEVLFEAIPQKEDLLIILSKKNKSKMLFTITGGDEYDQHVSWRRFEDAIMDNDQEALDRYIPKFESLVRKMKRGQNYENKND